MKKILLFYLPIILYSESVIVPDDYNITEYRDRSYIYSSEYKKILPKIEKYQSYIINEYEDEYGFKFDNKLKVGFASENNQIANAFSTQIPFNSQIFYGAGAGDIDYFCFNSWLKTLLLHETSHNFQLNPKENRASRISHKIVGNSPVTFLLGYPFFPIPNLMINSFILEGNAVLNESRFGNGGRLYSGYALAEVVAMARDGKILPEVMYNSTLNFPYGEKSYLIGGFFQQFLFERYGAKKVNSYFRLKSKQLFPFYTNSAFKETFGKSFEILLAEFVEDIKSKHNSYRITKGKVVAKSQFFVPLNRTSTEIYTLVGDYKSYPQILSLEKSTKKVSFKEGAYRVGEPFKIDGRYYITSSAKISPTKIKMGLLDNKAYMKEKTEGKIPQGFLENGDMVYFDIKKSLEIPNIYINGNFYDTANSSLFVDRNDLYYFKQNGHKKTLYKNKKPIFSYIGHYGFVADIDKNIIYFIALSKNGSTLYSYNKGNIKRVIDSDDIIGFKKIDKNIGLVATINSNGYKYQIVNLTPKSAKVFDTKYIEDKNSKITKNNKLFSPTNSKLKSKKYIPIRELEYSSLEQNMAYGDYEGFILNLKANFYDPAMQNSLGIIFSGDKQRLLSGFIYENTAHELEFGGDIFGVSHNKKYDSSDEDDYGYSAYLKFPFLAKGYYRASTTIDYINRYDSIYREPLTLSLDISNIKQFGISKYPNHQNIFNAFVSEDRENNSYGLSYSWLYGLGLESYIGFNGSYLKSDIVNTRKEKGIEIDNDWTTLQDEKSRVVMPTLDNTLYAKKAKIAEIGLYKSINTPLYFFSFPVSLQRENIYFKQKIYNIDFANSNKKYNETTMGLESDFVLLNNFTLPIKFEYLYNKDVKDKNLFRVLLGVEF